MSRRRAGVALCVGSATSFGALPIFGKIAFDHDANVVTFLFIRFAIACAFMWGLALAMRQSPRRHPPRLVVGGFMMGAVGYGVQSTTYFLALERIDASLIALIVYAYPAMVTGAAILLGRERATRPLLGALGVASIGTILLLGDGLAADADTLGVALAFAATTCYTTYILTGDTLVASLHPVLLTSLVTTGATTTFLGWGLFTGSFRFDLDGTAYLAIVGAGIVGTVLSVGTLLAGIERVGASIASVLSTVEPAVTVVLAIALLDESARAVQFVGGALLIVAIVLCQLAKTNEEPAPGIPA